MSLWSDYNKELLGWEEITEEGKGFIAYRILPPVCEIRDAYIAPEFRKSDLALKLREKLVEKAKEAGCTEIQSEVRLGVGDPERIMRFNIANGFKMFSANNNSILMVKFIGGSCG